jgi:hypothetical protein
MENELEADESHLKVLMIAVGFTEIELLKRKLDGPVGTSLSLVFCI